MEPSRSPAVRTAVMSASGGGPGVSMSRAPMAATNTVDPNRIYQEVMQHKEPAPQVAVSPLLAQARANLREQAGRGANLSFPPLGRVPLYNPAQDTRENFEQHTARLDGQLDSLRFQGALDHEILAFRLQRQAELDQMFPKQALRRKAEEEWKSSALLLKGRGVPAEEIRKYLKRKTTENLLPTPTELKAFIESRKQFATQIATISREAGGPVPQTGMASDSVRGQSAARPPVQPGAQPRGMVRTMVLHKL